MNRSLKDLVFASLCVALCVVLPLAFHSVPNAGSVLLPMHIPVLLCGLACGPWWGMATGALGPLLSSLITGMPPAAYLLPMVLELAAYGLAAGLCIRLIRTKSPLLNLYSALVIAMIIGRILFGTLNALIFRAGAYSMQLWLTAAFVTALPGIAIQLVLLPLLVRLLTRAHLLEER